MSQQRRLGRGLEALLGRSLDDPAPGPPPVPAPPPNGGDEQPAVATSTADNGLMTQDADGQRWLDLGVIQPNPYQPRRRFDEEEIADLTDSIREHGVLQPLIVRRAGEGFELVAGERRLRAAQAAGWERVPIQLREVDDRQTAELAIVENLQRKDLNAIEKATSFRRYLDEHGGTQDELAARVHVHRATVANLMRLLELPESVQAMVTDERLSQGHARALLGLPDSNRQPAAERVVREGLSVRATERLVKEASAGGDESLRVVGEDGVSRPSAPTRPAQIAALEEELRRTLGLKVELKQKSSGAGRVTIHFADGEEFERLRGRLAETASPAVREAS